MYVCMHACMYVCMYVYVALSLFRKLENEVETLKMLSTKLPPNDWDIQVNYCL